MPIGGYDLHILICGIADIPINRLTNSKEPSDHLDANESTLEVQSSSLEMFIVFRLGRERYGIPIAHVKEVMPLPGLVKLPQPPEAVLGAINVRGNVFAVLDTGAKINGHSVATTGGHLVVLDNDGFRIALLTEDIPQAESLDTSKLETNSQITGSNDQSFISGVLKTQSDFIIMLNVERFLESI